jgi:hypothetical protein
MQVKHAAIAGSSIGILSGIAICTIIDASLSDALFRISILAIGGAWMGMMLVWLDELLTPGDQSRGGHRSRRL